MEMVAEILHELSVPLSVHLLFSCEGEKRGEAACRVD
jgi:hypothetical protein